ncbi:unnamed protein product [Cuscuta epithymum]|uniref:F-box/LRR-repeat protein 15/At3g58940/PEG3-like LRR domain-containing protein n=2 Tax=Cuscuta epithymum TaxID=186058 RepID=A0AAV0D0J7_9ASTE|nr:unnamed protein product [Cuscuta epithymum]
MEERDRNIELPADILDKIMGKLWLGEAARMAVLNTVWRDAWFNLTKVCICEFDKLFLSVMKKGVQELDIQIFNADGRNYPLPSRVLKCPTLKTFHACSVKIDPTRPRCIFPNVTSLSFDGVHFDPSNQLNVVDLPKLRRLLFRGCKNIPHFNITAPKLGSLSIQECYIGRDHDDDNDCRSDCDDEDYYLGDDDKDYNSDDDDYRYAANNDDVSCYNDSSYNGGDGDRNMFCYCPANGKDKSSSGFLPTYLDLGSVRWLHLCCDAVGGVVDDLGRMGPQMTALDVKYLNLSGVYFPDSDNNSKFIKLLRSCPKLYKLEICFQLQELDLPSRRESVSRLLEGLHKLHHIHNTANIEAWLILRVQNRHAIYNRTDRLLPDM